MHAATASAHATPLAPAAASSASAHALPCAKPVPELMSEQVESAGRHGATRMRRSNRVPAGVSVLAADGEADEIG